MTLDRRVIALTFLALALGTRLVLPVAALGGVIIGLVPYLVLVLASFSVTGRGAIWGGGIALVLADAVESTHLWRWERALATPAQLYGESSWHLLTSSPASAVFVLPVGMVLGSWIGDWVCTGEPRETRPTTRTRSERLAYLCVLLGAVLIVTTSLIGGSNPLGSLVFAAWAFLPYGILVLAARLVPNAWAIAGAGAGLIAAEAGIRAAVFVLPRGSTAALALIFSPLVLSVVVLPAGGAAGWLLGRAWATGGVAVRTAVAVAAAVLLGLVTTGLARPDLMPWAVMRRQAAWNRIGEPRVVVGGEAFETAIVSEASAWHQTGDFDGAPGDEIAVVDHRGATLVDPQSFQPRGRVTFGTEPGRLWNWYSALARLDGRLVVAQTGGGFAETEVLELDGRLVWRYRPDPQLPPRALTPADLDADGRVEFYVSAGTSIVRLDGAGHEVWRNAAPYGAALLLSKPRTASTPAWVVAYQQPSGVTIWDETGRRLAALPAPGSVGVMTVADWPDRRTLFTGASTLRGIDIGGKVVFEFPLGDLTFLEAVAVRFERDERPYLAVVAVAPRDVQRWRLCILSPDREIVYDEVFAHAVRLLTARGVDGGATLLVSGEGLRAIRPRANHPAASGIRDPKPATVSAS